VIEAGSLGSGDSDDVVINATASGNLYQLAIETFKIQYPFLGGDRSFTPRLAVRGDVITPTYSELRSYGDRSDQSDVRCGLQPIGSGDPRSSP
jgi:hypothetical protein